MSAKSAGVRRSTNKYMVSRQVQKLSSPLAACSASPAIPRWNAWLCRLTMPGTATPAIRSAPRGGLPATTDAIAPPSMPMATSDAHPDGSSARSKKSVPIVVPPRGADIAFERHYATSGELSFAREMSRGVIAAQSTSFLSRRCALPSALRLAPTYSAPPPRARAPSTPRRRPCRPRGHRWRASCCLRGSN